jgi:hypothetical protein
VGAGALWLGAGAFNGDDAALSAAGFGAVDRVAGV